MYANDLSRPGSCKALQGRDPDLDFGRLAIGVSSDDALAEDFHGKSSSCGGVPEFDGHEHQLGLASIGKVVDKGILVPQMSKVPGISSVIDHLDHAAVTVARCGPAVCQHCPKIGAVMAMGSQRLTRR